jgi:hypothetical protein
MKEKCMGCGVEKDWNILERYPYPEQGLVEDPIKPLFALDCEPWEDVPEEHRKWRRAVVCHECFHKLDPDMWISSRCWKRINAVTPFEMLPLLYRQDK